MGHRIAEAVIEDGMVKQIDRKLPIGKVKVHIIYDEQEENIAGTDSSVVTKSAFGIYKNMDFDPDSESKNLREDWERALGK
ncbi:MAG: hypothetical protein EPN22_03580 [Nitrospirae bacterium]|nr:MAG: hypothetical protein EPN22_03580 [Nitrospirota bacterium]